MAVDFPRPLYPSELYSLNHLYYKLLLNRAIDICDMSDNGLHRFNNYHFVLSFLSLDLIAKNS